MPTVRTKKREVGPPKGHEVVCHDGHGSVSRGRGWSVPNRGAVVRRVVGGWIAREKCVKRIGGDSHLSPSRPDQRGCSRSLKRKANTVTHGALPAIGAKRLQCLAPALLQPLLQLLLPTPASTPPPPKRGDC